MLTNPCRIFRLPLEMIFELRLAVIQEILDFYHRQFDCRTQKTPYCLHAEKTPSNPLHQSSRHKLCDNAVIGAIVARHQWYKLDPIPREAKNAGNFTINTLLDHLHLVLDGIDPLDKNHAQCLPGPELFSLDAKIRNEARWENILPPRYIERLDVQRKKAGVSSRGEGGDMDKDVKSSISSATIWDTPSSFIFLLFLLFFSLSLLESWGEWDGGT